MPNTEQNENNQIVDKSSRVTEEAPTIPTPGAGKGSKNKLVWWVLGLIGLAVIGYGGYYFGTQKSNSVNNSGVKPGPINQEIQKTIKIQGKVINKITQEGIVGAEVASNSTKSTTTSDGAFTISLPETGDAKITVTSGGFIETSTKAADGMTISLVPQGRVVFASNKDGGKRGIYTVNFDGSQEKALVERVGESENYNPVVSPRNRYVAFLSTRNERKNRYGSNDAELYLVKIDGSELTKISDFYGVSNIQWSPDGTYLAWSGREKDEDNNSKIAVRDIDKTSTVFNGDPGEYLGSYSYAKDDTKMSFYVSNNNENASRKGIYIADGNGNNAKKVSDISSFATFNEDGNLEFSEYKDKDKKTHYYVWYHDSSEVKEVAKKDDTRRNGEKSPDKKLVAYIDNRDGKTNVFVSKLDKSAEKQLTDINSATGSPRWTQDGKYIIFDLYKTGESAKYIVSSEGKGKAQKITDQLLSGGEMGGYN